MKVNNMEDNKSNKNLQNATKAKAITLLGSGMNKTDVANQLGISRDVIYDWLKDDDFVNAINLAIETSVNHLIKLLSRLDDKVIKTLERLLDSQNDALALKAVLGFIEARKSLGQLEHIYNRIHQLESMLLPKFKVVDKTHKELLEGATKCAEATNKLETMMGK